MVRSSSFFLESDWFYTILVVNSVLALVPFSLLFMIFQVAEMYNAQKNNQRNNQEENEDDWGLIACLSHSYEVVISCTDQQFY